MNRYSITEYDETGVYERGDAYFLYVTIRDKITKAESTPSSVLITIADPCGTELVTDAIMTSGGSGVYTYDYDILDTALYGKYDVTVSTTTYSMKKKFSYYILPWDANAEVRHISGIGQNKSISDAALNELIWESYQEVLHEVYVHHYDEAVRCNCCNENCNCSSIVCSSFDGSNTTFWTQEGYLADYSGDGSVKGYGELSCATDVLLKWKDCDGVCHDGYVSVLDADCGKLKLTRDGTVPIPADYAWVKLEYWTKTRGWTESLMYEAVNYLAAHKALLRFGELERATSADLVSAQNVKYVDPARMKKEYKRVIRKIKKPVVGGV